MTPRTDATPFRILYKLFVFRLVDIELLSANALGDSNKLLGQIAALLIFISLFFSVLAGAMTGERNAPASRLTTSWNAEHQFLATALLIATVLALLNWDSFFPDRRDVMILSPLPVKPVTVFFAKAAALASVAGVLTSAFCAFPTFCYSVALAPPAKFGFLDIGTWAGAARSFLAFAVTVAAACLLPIATIAILQSLGSAVFRRALWLRVSGFLQIGLFALAVVAYFLAPPISEKHMLVGEWVPSQWLVGIFESVRGQTPGTLAPLARRGWICIALLIPIASACYGLSYVTVTRQVVEEPDITPSRRAPWFSMRVGGLLETAIVLFSLRSLIRSKQHRVVLALFLGVALAIVIGAVRTPVAVQLSGSRISPVGLPGLIASTVAMLLAILGVRLVYALPLELRANWVFRTIPGPSATAAKRATRRALLLTAVAPVLAGTVAAGMLVWPAREAMGHAAVLATLALVVTELCVSGFDKLPFTCSYLPGKSNFNMAFLGFAALLETGVIQFAAWERGILGDPVTMAKLLAGLALTWAALYYRTWSRASSGEIAIQFEEGEEPAISGLGLYRDGVLPLSARQR